MLDRILADTRRRVEALRHEPRLPGLEGLAQAAPPPPSLAERLRAPGVQLIAEVKRRSPSRGDLAPGLDPAALATGYACGGAAAISVLTEPFHFNGSLADLDAVRTALQRDWAALPLLRKDFLLDPIQVMEARAYGAAAVLLIAAALAPGDLARLYQEAEGWGLGALCEVHDERDLDAVLTLGARIVGINSRNLRDMTVDLGVVERLRPRAPAGVLVVAESGVRGPADVRRLRDLGVDAVLVGEALVCAPDPEKAARALVEAGR